MRLVTLGFGGWAFVGCSRGARRGLHRLRRAGAAKRVADVPRAEGCRMGGERAAEDATSAVDGRALWRRVVSVAERRSSGTVPSCSARDRAMDSSCAVHREFTASVRELSSGLRTVGERKGRCSPRSERQLRPPTGASLGPGCRPVWSASRPGHDAARTPPHLPRVRVGGRSATRPVTAAYVCSTPTRGADPREKEHST
jgi:hypothetical protein